MSAISADIRAIGSMAASRVVSTTPDELITARTTPRTLIPKVLRGWLSGFVDRYADPNSCAPRGTVD